MRPPTTTPMLAVFLSASLSLAGAQAGQTSTADEDFSRAKAIYSQQGAKLALPEYEKVLAEYRSAKDRRGEAITLGLIGNCYKRLGEYRKALSFLESALAIKREIDDRPEEGRTLSHLGLVLWEQGDYPKAIERFNQAIAIARELKDIQLEASALNNLSLVYDEQGDYPRSLQQYERALELHRSVKYEPGESDTLGNIGGVYLLLGRYSDAAGYYQEALEISERLGLKPSQTQDLGNLGLCEIGLGKLQESITTLNRAIEIARAAGMAKEEADWHRAKASALVALGQFNEALRAFNRAKVAYVRAGLKRELGELLGDLGEAHLALGDRVAAEVDFRQAVAISKQIGHKRGSLDNLLSIAEVQRRAKQSSKAQHNAADGLKAARDIDDGPAVVRSLLLLGKIQIDQQRLDQASVYTEEAQRLANDRHLVLLHAEALDQLCELRIYRRRFAEALDLSERAQQIASSAGDLELQWRAGYHRGEALEALGRNDEALTSYRAAVSVIESVRSRIAKQRYKTGYLQEKQRVYVALVRLLLKMGKPTDAFTYSERLREYSYRVNIHRPSPSPRNPRVLELQGRIQRLEDLSEQEKERPADEQRSPALKTYSDELIEAQREYEAVTDTGTDDKASVVTALAGVDFKRIRENMPRNAAVIEFVVDQNCVVTFVLTRAGLHATTVQISDVDLRAKVELLRALIRDRNGQDWRKPAASLYTLLIAPLERRGWLVGVDSLLLVPHSILNYLPFAALPSTSDAGSAVLIESYELAELPSAMSLVSAPAARKEGQSSLLAFAPSRSHLEYAVPEAEEVARSFSPGSYLVTGGDATETRFKDLAGKFDLIHLATHGYFNRVNPGFSGLQLEADARNDGRLEVHEIVEMRLHARLVTLSACETGLGGGDFDEIPAGDEFVGLNRAFLEAGSTAVLATLWEVNDRSTLTMMKRLYGALADHGGVAALTESQRQMLKDPQYKQPFYWASFVYVGKNFSYSRIFAEKP